MRRERSEKMVQPPTAVSPEVLRQLLAQKEDEANARLAREFSARLARLQFQEALSERLGRVTDLYELGRVLLDSLHAEFGVQAAMVGVVLDSQFLEVVAATSIVPPQYALDLMEEAFVVGETLSTTGEDTDQLHALGTAHMPPGVPLLAVPLFKQEGLPLGVVYLEGAVREDRVDWLPDFLSLISLALEDCLLYNQIEQHITDAVLAIALANEAREPLQAGHIRRVEDLSAQIGRALGLEATEQKHLRLMALLHDLSPEAIAEAFGAIRRGKETAQAWQTLMADPFVGGIYPSPLANFQRVVDDLRYLRCRFDGKGNAPAAQGTEIPLGARVVAVAEAFEHMTGGRSHRTTLPIPEALAQLQRYAGAQYDPAIIQALCEEYATVEMEYRVAPTDEVF